MNASPTSRHALAIDGYSRIWHLVGDRKRGLPAVVPLCKASIWKRVREGSFPAPRRHGRCTMWRNAEVIAWLEQLDKREAA